MSRTNRSVAHGDRSRTAVRRLECSMEWPPGHAAAYLLEDDEPILIDAGMAGDEAREELVAGLEDHGYQPGDVEHVLLTHAHVDHVGQVRTILEAGDATVYAPRRIRDRFQRDVATVESATRANLIEAGVTDAYLDHAVDRLREAHQSTRNALPTETVDVWLEAGETVTVGDREFEPIYTPGHHVTHHCYGTTLGNQRVLFAGDVAIEPFRSVAIQVNFDDGVRDGVAAYLETLDRLEAHSFDRVYPGHGPVHDSYAGAVAQSRADLEDRIASVRAALERRDEPAPATAIGDDLIDSFAKRARLLPEFVAALDYLEREGEVRSHLEDDVRYYEPA